MEDPWRKLWLTMRLTTFLLLIAFLHTNASGIAQEVTIKEMKISLKDAFREVKKQTGYNFLWAARNVTEDVQVRGDLDKVPLNEALTHLLEGLALTYTVEDETILIREATRIQSIRTPERSPAQRSQDGRQVMGRVVDSAGNPLLGVNIYCRELNKSVHTNASGIFKITTDNWDKISLRISYIGYETTTREFQAAAGPEPQLIVMKSSMNLLDESIVIAYGATTRRLNTGSVAHISSAEIEKQPVGNVLQALQGRVAGMEVNQTNGYASAPMNLQIRGRKDLFSDINTYDASSQPLYVIDGVPMMAGFGDYTNSGLNQNGFAGPAGGQSPIFSINPSDVESIDVLRDADATSIFGSRGANGVVMITTKKAKPGQSSLTVNSYTGITTSPRKMELMNTEQYLEMRREAFANDGIDYETEPFVQAIDLLEWDQSRYTDWQKELSTSSITSDIQLGYSAGSEHNSFRFSGGYYKFTPPVPETFSQNFKEERLSSRLSFNHRSVDNRFSASLVANLSAQHSNLAGGSYSNYFLAPNAPAILNEDGKLNWEEYGDVGLDDFVGMFQPYNANTISLSGTISLNYMLTKGLDLSASFGLNNNKMEQIHIQPKSATNPNMSFNESSTRYGENSYNNWVVEPKLNYTTVIGGGRLHSMIGATLQNDVTKGNNLHAVGFVDESLLEHIGAASTITGTDNYSQYRYQGYFARANYNFQNKYIVNLSGRIDGSSRFRPGRQLATFGSLAGAWIFTEEPLFNRLGSFLSFGKLRASYGTAGSANAGDYEYLTRWRSNAGLNYDGISVMQLISPPNANYSWQVNRKFEAAIELGLFEDKLALALAHYTERSGNQLVRYPYPSFVTPMTVVANIPALVENRGWELTMYASSIGGGHFKWSPSFNISFNANELKKFPGIEYSPYRDVYVVGKPLSIQKVLHYQGIDPATGEYLFEDQDGDGIINAFGVLNDKVGLLNLAPKFFGGLSNTFEYRGWQLSAMLEFKKQQGPYGYTLNTPGSMHNQPVTALDRWQKEGDEAKVHRYTQNYLPSIQNYNASDANIVDASFIRLQNVSLSYNLPMTWINRFKMTSCRIYVQAQNVLTFSNYQGLDPATPSLYLGFPPQKVFTGGIQFNF